MKRKILALGLFSVCCLSLFTTESQAFFGLFCHNKYVTQITCRPYNAFTPICWGNLVCDGCCPNPCGVAGGCLPMCMGMPPFASMGGCGMPYMGGGCSPQYSQASDMPRSGPQAPMPDGRTQPAFTPPMPMPMPMAPGTTMAYPQQGVAQANYYPMYVPQYYQPNYYQPYYNPAYTQPMPYYWYGSGR